MIGNIIKYYAVLRLENSSKAIRYVITHQTGDYAPNSELVGRNGHITLTINPPVGKVGEMVVSSKRCYLLTLHRYINGDEVTKYAYGIPTRKESYKNNGIVYNNPLRNSQDDCFLFLFGDGQLEIFVIPHAHGLDRLYLRMLILGKLDEEIEALRENMRPWERKT